MPSDNISQRAKFGAIRSIAASTFTGSFQAVGIPLDVNPRMLIIQNDTSVSVTFTDSLTTGSAMELISKERLVLDLNANRNNTIFSWPLGTQFYVSGSAGTGTFKISVIYGD
jgi:hypothetical protein